MYWDHAGVSEVEGERGGRAQGARVRAATTLIGASEVAREEDGELAALSLFLLSSHQNPHNTMLAGVEGPPTG